MEKKRIILINWRWIEPHLPIFPTEGSKLSEGQEDLESWKSTFETEWEHYVQSWPEDLLGKADKVHEKKEVVSAWILRVDLNFKSVGEEAKQQFALEKILETFRSKLGVSALGSVELLAFFHEKHGFLANMGQDFPMVSQGTSEEQKPAPVMKYFSFGGGIGALYSKYGLLNVGKGDYSKGLTKEQHAGIYGEDKQLIAIKSRHFDYVWDHYWSGVYRRIGAIRKLYHTALIPGTNLEAQLKTVLKHLHDILTGEESITELSSDLKEYRFDQIPDFQDTNFRQKHYRLNEEAWIREIEHIRSNNGNLYSQSFIKLLDEEVAKFSA